MVWHLAAYAAADSVGDVSLADHGLVGAPGSCFGCGHEALSLSPIHIGSERDEAAGSTDDLQQCLETVAWSQT
jgi:hypothetical protein